MNNKKEKKRSDESRSSYIRKQDLLKIHWTHNKETKKGFSFKKLPLAKVVIFELQKYNGS
jgi:hypothetical protein